MRVIAIHAISDPEAFWGGQLNLPEGTELPVVVPSSDGTRGVCIFTSDSVEVAEVDHVGIGRHRRWRDGSDQQERVLRDQRGQRARAARLGSRRKPMGQVYLQRFCYAEGVTKAELDQAWGEAFKAFARSGNWGDVDSGVKHHQSYGTGWGGYALYLFADPSARTQRTAGGNPLAGGRRCGRGRGLPRGHPHRALEHKPLLHDV